MFTLPANEIGGAVVRRTFTSNGRRLTPPMRLSAEEVLAFPPLNRNALAEKRYIDLIPKASVPVSDNRPSQLPSAPSDSERFVISAGFGKFNVIEGVKLNPESLNREQAYALAGIEEPPKRKIKKPVTE